MEKRAAALFEAIHSRTRPSVSIICRAVGIQRHNSIHIRAKRAKKRSLTQ